MDLGDVMTEMYKDLTKLIKEHNHIFIMAHKNIDLDGLGSAICLYTIIKSFKKDCYVMLNEHEKNTSIVKALANLKETNITIDFVSHTNYASYVASDSMVIVLDTHKRNMVECPTLLDRVNDIVVMDHHVKSGDTIDHTVLSYVQANLSSMNELMVGYLRYLNKEVDATIATIMLSGIEIDTNAFNIKTSITTYEAAAILARMGADNIVKQELLQENKEVYIKRQQLILNSFHYGDNFEICVLDDHIYERKDLALVSETLLKFEDVEASFTIGKTGPYKVGISARSLGRVNVEKYMALLGGGGHFTDAAVQLIETDVEQVKELLLNTIKEGGKQ